MYEGRTSAKPGIVFGHENLGIVEEVSSGVTDIKAGDRVVMPFNIGYGPLPKTVKNNITDSVHMSTHALQVCIWLCWNGTLYGRTSRIFTCSLC